MPGDLKTFWDTPVLSTTDLSSDVATSSGSDPNADGGDGAAEVNPVWANPPVPTLSDKSESPNSVSGLPSLPNRYEPPNQPPEPPTLQDRRPGTIDET